MTNFFLQIVKKGDKVDQNTATKIRQQLIIIDKYHLRSLRVVYVDLALAENILHVCQNMCITRGGNIEGTA